MRKQNIAIFMAASLLPIGALVKAWSQPPETFYSVREVAQTLDAMITRDNPKDPVGEITTIKEGQIIGRENVRGPDAIYRLMVQHGDSLAPDQALPWLKNVTQGTQEEAKAFGNLMQRFFDQKSGYEETTSDPKSRYSATRTDRFDQVRFLSFNIERSPLAPKPLVAVYALVSRRNPGGVIDIDHATFSAFQGKIRSKQERLPRLAWRVAIDPAATGNGGAEISFAWRLARGTTAAFKSTFDAWNAVTTGRQLFTDLNNQTLRYILKLAAKAK